MIEIRHASKEDEQDLLDWRNDRHTVSTSLSNSAVLPENHAKWFGEIVKKKNCPILIAEQDNQKIGMVRFDKSKNCFMVSINLNPIHRGKGLGSRVLLLAEDFFFIKRSEIVAQVKAENIASVKLFTKCGYNLTENKDNNSLELIFTKAVLI